MQTDPLNLNTYFTTGVYIDRLSQPVRIKHNAIVLYHSQYVTKQKLATVNKRYSPLYDRFSKNYLEELGQHVLYYPEVPYMTSTIIKAYNHLRCESMHSPHYLISLPIKPKTVTIDKYYHNVIPRARKTPIGTKLPGWMSIPDQELTISSIKKMIDLIDNMKIDQVHMGCLFSKADTYFRDGREYRKNYQKGHYSNMFARTVHREIVNFISTSLNDNYIYCTKSP